MHNARSRKVEEQAGLGWLLGPQGMLASAIPEFEYRPAQLQMAEAVERAIATGETLLAEAGTGTGKTLAYLVPAILSGKKTVVATGTKTLQEQLFFKDIPLLARTLPRTFVASLMKGRGNYLCRRSLRRALTETHTRPERQRLVKIQKWSATSLRGDRAELDFLSDTDPLWDDVAAWSETCLGTACEDYESCFLTRMRQEAAAADLVIVNHHLLLADAALREGSLFQVIPSYATLILDEAHLLEDVATDFFGTEISNLRIERLVRDAEREWRGSAAGDASIPTQLMRLAEASARFFRSLDFAEGARRLREEALGRLSAAAGRDLVQHLILLHDLIHALPGKPEALLGCARRAREQADILHDFLRPGAGTAQTADERPLVRWSERRGRALVLRTSPLDVSADFRRAILESAETVVLTSATLSAAGRFDFLRGRLGIERAREFQAASPFEYPEQAILYIPRHLPDPRDRSFPGGGGRGDSRHPGAHRRASPRPVHQPGGHGDHLPAAPGHGAVPPHGAGRGAPHAAPGPIPAGCFLGAPGHAKFLAGGGRRGRGPELPDHPQAPLRIPRRPGPGGSAGIPPAARQRAILGVPGALRHHHVAPGVGTVDPERTGPWRAVHPGRPPLDEGVWPRVPGEPSALPDDQRPRGSATVFWQPGDWAT